MQNMLMKMKQLFFFLGVSMMIFGTSGMAQAGHEHDAKATPSEHGSHGSASDQKAMDHSSMETTFSHEAIVDGIRAEFQVMSLAAMKMTDPEGNTHHVMVKFFDHTSKDQIKDAAGKIKVIAPSGKEQVATLKDYSGIFAANFTIEQKGKYGIICLFKIGDKKRVAKFWYEHGS
jgi:hypothetical protein